MIEQKDCPICGGPVSLEYVRPDFFYDIEDGKIVRDTNHDLWDGTKPFLRFRCSNDMTHNLEIVEETGMPNTDLTDWMQRVEKEFYDKKLYQID